VPAALRLRLKGTDLAHSASRPRAPTFLGAERAAAAASASAACVVVDVVAVAVVVDKAASAAGRSGRAFRPLAGFTGAGRRRRRSGVAWRMRRCSCWTIPRNGSAPGATSSAALVVAQHRNSRLLQHSRRRDRRQQASHRRQSETAVCCSARGAEIDFSGHRIAVNQLEPSGGSQPAIRLRWRRAPRAGALAARTGTVARQPHVSPARQHAADHAHAFQCPEQPAELQRRVKV
jgi:hypothetical protein